MRTVSKYLFELLKPHIEQLICVAETSIDVMLKEHLVFLSSGDVLTTPYSPDLLLSATLYSYTEWKGQLLLEVGSLKFRSCSRKPFPTHPSELAVTWLAKPGKETQDILEILKENFK